MKLYRFTALDTHRAMIKVNETLGEDVVIYSTRKIPHGIEILAGYPNDERADDVATSVEMEAAESNRDLIDKLSMKLQYIDDSIQKLMLQINTFREESRYRSSQNWLEKFKHYCRHFKEGTYAKQPVL